MKLEGSLDAFSLPDIFQLLSFTKKTGGLHLAHGGSDGVVFFAGGQISGASADSSRQPLARRLVGTGTLTDDSLTAAVEVATSGAGVGVARALLEQGVVDADLLRRAATDQSVDAVFDLQRWKDGDFAFVMDEGNPDDVGVALSVESVLADVEARQSSWDDVSQVVTSPRAVLAMAVVLPADPQVSREEWSLLALVDGRRGVTDLVDLTGSGQYAVVSALAALVQRGLLEVRPEIGAAEDHVTVVVRRQHLLAPLEGVPFVPDDEVEGDGDERELETAMLGGAHVPGDVVPPRSEPFLPKRQADFDDHTGQPLHSVQVQAGPSASMGGLGDVVGATATAPDPDAGSVIERDPNVNRSLMLRLIAGVRGL